MLYLDLKSPERKIYKEDELYDIVSDQFSEAFGFMPSDDCVREIVENADDYVQLPEMVHEAIFTEGDSKGYKCVLGLMESTLLPENEEDLDGAYVEIKFHSKTKTAFMKSKYSMGILTLFRSMLKESIEKDLSTYGSAIVDRLVP